MAKIARDVERLEQRVVELEREAKAEFDRGHAYGVKHQEQLVTSLRDELKRAVGSIVVLRKDNAELERNLHTAQEKFRNGDLPFRDPFDFHRRTIQIDEYSRPFRFVIGDEVKKEKGDYKAYGKVVARYHHNNTNYYVVVDSDDVQFILREAQLMYWG